MLADKHDQGKPRLELLPPHAVVELGYVLKFGAEKYGEFNYLKGTGWSRFAGAALRHIYAWIRGEDNDPESGLPHLAHAAVSCMMIIEYQRRGIAKDDRFKQGDSNE